MIAIITKEKLEEETLKVIENLQNEKFQELNEMFRKKRPYDMSIIFQSLPEKHGTALLHNLDETTIASMMQKINTMQKLEVLGKIGPEKANKVLALLDTNILTRLLKKYPQVKITKFLEDMDAKNASYVKSMIDYPDNTAGSLMTNRYISIEDNSTVRDAINKIRADALYTEGSNHLYLTDKKGKLTGTVPYKDLLLGEPNEMLRNIMLKQVLCVTVSTKRANIVRLLQRYDFTALPVTNEEGVLVGIITFDNMVDALIQETSDDYGKLSTASKEIDFNTKPFIAAFRRLPWLIILLFIGLISGSIISKFEGTLEKVVALAFFMPLIAGMTGNTGTQSLAVVVRGLAENEIDAKTVVKLILREFRVSLLIGVTCGLLISIIAFIWQGNIYLGIVVGGSLLFTLILGTMAGTIIPLILYKCKLDPAVASGPLITTVNDIFSLITYFSIASLLLSKLT
ncbi:magnesium transporter [Lederbergia wuyishanensis]|uniref:Magnesium transporter MgtE n=1 Tax=Lederbergia wuyishanensis TaxID=1347903 RepID=A0ABU0DAR6_9BACI|nr:magnesium transporter [Lederbergia wuyishanensis]MCJ8009656.1 magnesium transporter [Lederbergia wuyishanensis]MDQ0345470.1 magnesium transporter [Lederbergia wuyishanensis]